jgi:hypothetical protein
LLKEAGRTAVKGKEAKGEKVKGEEVEELRPYV